MIGYSDCSFALLYEASCKENMSLMDIFHTENAIDQYLFLIMFSGGGMFERERESMQIRGL